MFLMFAMTSDAVGSVIPKVIEQFRLNMKEAGAFHYVPMASIALGALLLGWLADALGRKPTIVAGLALYGSSSLLFAFEQRFAVLVGLLGLAGLGIGVFKIGALALIGDLSRSTREHTALMNAVEGFFGLGAILGPAIVATLVAAGMSWKWLYVIAACVCGALILIALTVRYPSPQRTGAERIDLRRQLRMMGDRYALGFSLLIMLYVAVEVAIYVWMPTYLRGYEGSYKWLSVYALSIFFVLRAAGRFLGVWLLHSFRWTAILALFALAIFLCFAGSSVFGTRVGVFLLPLSGLFMSMMYPTLNSKGISCFPPSAHGTVAGVILFFTALAAALGPLAMAVVSDLYGDAKYGFVLATACAGLLLLGLIYNWSVDPARRRLEARDGVESDQARSA